MPLPKLKIALPSLLMPLTIPLAPFLIRFLNPLKNLAVLVLIPFVKFLNPADIPLLIFLTPSLNPCSAPLIMRKNAYKLSLTMLKAFCIFLKFLRRKRSNPPSKMLVRKPMILNALPTPAMVPARAPAAFLPPSSSASLFLLLALANNCFFAFLSCTSLLYCCFKASSIDCDTFTILPIF